jgi:hypothetical protein
VFGPAKSPNQFWYRGSSAVSFGIYLKSSNALSPSENRSSSSGPISSCVVGVQITLHSRVVNVLLRRVLERQSGCQQHAWWQIARDGCSDHKFSERLVFVCWLCGVYSACDPFLHTGTSFCRVPLVDPLERQVFIRWCHAHRPSLSGAIMESSSQRMQEAGVACLGPCSSLDRAGASDIVGLRVSGCRHQGRK